MDAGPLIFVLIVALILGAGLGYTLRNARQLRRRAIDDWAARGYDVALRPALVWCYTTQPRGADPRYGSGALAVAGDALLLRSQAGHLTIIPLRDVQWIAAGYMWRMVFGAASYAPFLLIAYTSDGQPQTLAFYSIDNRRFCRDLSVHSHGYALTCRRIPRGFRVWNGRLITPEDVG